jgi:molecular chaperone Hsp33
MPHSPAPPDSSLEVTTWFVRGRNALLARAEFSPLYVDYYLHLSDHSMRYSPAHDSLLKDVLAALVLHAAGRPWNETIAWTLNFQDPLVNLFATVDNSLGQIVGQAFTEDVRENDHNLFFSDVVAGSKPRRRSVVPFEKADVFSAVETFYAQSEQRPARLFRVQEEEFIMVSAQPDCDTDWMERLDLTSVCAMEDMEKLGFLEKRSYEWKCGCSQERMCQVLAPAMRVDPDGLFGEMALLRCSCPRCGARHKITREALEAFLARDSPPSKSD